MKKWIAMVLALALTLCVAGVALAEDNSLAALKERGKLILGLDDGFPPMGFRNEKDEIVGFDIDLAREVCARLGVELVLQPIDWKMKELELDSGNIDCIWNGMSITPDREAGMALTDAYLNNKMVFVVNVADGYASDEDFFGKPIGVQSGSYAEKLLDVDRPEYKAKFSEVLAYEDYLKALLDLQNGNTAGVLIDFVVAEYLLTNMEDGQYEIVGNLGDDKYAVGFRKDDVQLRDEVNAIFKQIKADGTMETISGTWFGSDITLIEVE